MIYDIDRDLIGSDQFHVSAILSQCCRERAITGLNNSEVWECSTDGAYCCMVINGNDWSCCNSSGVSIMTGLTLATISTIGYHHKQ